MLSCTWSTTRSGPSSTEHFVPPFDQSNILKQWQAGWQFIDSSVRLFVANMNVYVYILALRWVSLVWYLSDRKRQSYRSFRDDMGIENGISSRLYLEFALSCSASNRSQSTVKWPCFLRMASPPCL